MLLLLSVLAFPAVAENGRVQTARDTGIWEVRERETLLGIAGQLLPGESRRYLEFVRDVTRLNFTILGGVQRNNIQAGDRISLPDYVRSPLGRQQRQAAAARAAVAQAETDSAGIAPASPAPEPRKAAKQSSPRPSSRVARARKSGSITTQAGETMFGLARLFYPDRESAQQLFIQEVMRINSQVFEKATINAIPSGTVLELPGYVLTTITGRRESGKLASRTFKPRQKTPAAASMPVDEAVSGATSSVVAVSPRPVEALPAERMSVQDTRVKQAPSATAPDPQVYVDAYLADDPDYVDRLLEDHAGNKPGRRSLDLASHYYRNDDDFLGTETEAGINLHYRRETLNYGEIDVESSVNNYDYDRLNQVDQDTSLLLTLRQTEMPLDSNWYLNTTLGHQRTVASPFLQGGYRFRLPTSPLLGLSGEAQSREERVQWFLGNTGDYRGFVLRQFEEDSGKLAGAAYERQLSPELRLGGKLLHLQDHEEVAEHSSLLLGGRYQQAGRLSFHELHLLADDDSQMGLWTDSANYLDNGFTLRYGLYYIEPRLLWSDAAIANDQQGIYTRMDRRGYRHDFSVGYDYYETGLDDAITQSDNHSLFFSTNYRASRDFTFGASSNFAQRNFSAADNERQDSWRLQGYLYQRMLVGTSRYEIFASEQDGDNASSQRDSQGLRWSHDWRMPRRFRLTTELSYETENHADDTRDNWLAGTIFRHDLNDEFSWNINAAVIRSDSDQAGASNDISLNASTRWQFHPHWYTSLTVNMNQATTDPDISDFITEDEEIMSDGFWLTLGYARNSGRAYPNFGAGVTRAGAGNLYGVVFYDENRDGIQQPGEKPASGVILMLDGRYEIRTDSRGQYSYDPVPAGQHTIRIVIEDLPLPWGLEDETPRSVSVGVRSNQSLDFPLIRLDH